MTPTNKQPRATFAFLSSTHLELRWTTLFRIISIISGIATICSMLSFAAGEDGIRAPGDHHAFWIFLFWANVVIFISSAVASFMTKDNDR